MILRNPKHYLPLILIEVYLVLTLIIFAYGPVNYEITHPELFWFYILSFHLFFIFGYIIACVTFRPINNYHKYRLPSVSDLSNYRFSIILLLALMASLLSFKGASVAEVINPAYWVRSAVIGIVDPGAAYVEKMARVDSSVSNKSLNIFLFFISFSKLTVFTFLVFGWSNYSWSLKLLALFVILLPVLSSVSNGTNKSLFDFVIILSVVISIKTFYLAKAQRGKRSYVRTWITFFAIFLLFCLVFYYFGKAMGGRGGSLTYIERVDPLGNISVKDYAKLLSEENFLFYIFAWLSTYIVQGYYGFSLSMLESFDFTFFVGNSEFLTRNFEALLGVELQSKTYQSKIDSVWDASAQWHSFYSYLANDFYIAGVVVPMLLLGYMVAYVWMVFVNTGNIYAGSLVPVFAIMIFFMPANNQVFGFLDGLSSFCVLSFLLWCSGRKSLRKFV